MALTQEKVYTIDDIYALPEGQRAELIDGRMYMMAPPSMRHQRILMNLAGEIREHIKKHHGSCEVFPAPFAVFLNEDDINYVEPDISVICDRNKLTEKGCNGAPDWIIEITSPTNPQNDYAVKLFKYRTANVREYWIVNPQKETVMVYDLEREERSNQYDFEEDIPVCIYDDFYINIADLLS
ncbi:MAG: Uma2 family endonuclease [Lachnospiraceae bacterium]|nr:Uma2 family endonuclease [Lachnospiraceae bacterium]MDE6620565.1 Uma2 family endonuclease [Lachnospiraceae bacterium]